MNNDDFDRLVAKYKKGETTLDEEQRLYAHNEHTDASLDAWFTFVKTNKTQVPENVNDILWEAFSAKRTKTRKIGIRSISVAASVILIIALFMGLPKQDKLNYAQKEALLNEALNMFPNEETEVNEQDIIYENDMIIVYTTRE